MDEGEGKFWELIHPGGIRGVVLEKPEMQEQDAEFEPGEFYAAVFFPKITGIGKASALWPRTVDTLSNSPKAAKVKYLDGIKKGETWETYADAGWRIRKVRVIDLGDADD